MQFLEENKLANLTRGDLLLFLLALTTKYGLAYAFFGDFYAQVFDNLDSVVPYSVVAGRFWASGFDTSVFDVFIGGNSEWYHYFQAVSPQTVPYALFAPPTAYFVTEIFGLAIAFFGAKLLFLMFDLSHSQARILALIFSFSASFSSYGLGLLGAPLIYWFALRSDRPSIGVIIATVLIGLSSSLALHGFFLPPSLLAIMWVFNKWEKLVQAFSISVLFLASSLASSLGLIYANLAGAPMHRIEMTSDVAAPTIGEAFAKAAAHVLILDGSAHALVLPALFAAFTLLAALVSGDRKIRYFAAKVVILLMVAGLAGAYNNQIERLVPGALKSIQFSRIRLFSAIPLFILGGIIWQRRPSRWSLGILLSGLTMYTSLSFLAMSGVNPDNLKASVHESRMPQLVKELRDRKLSALLSVTFYQKYGIGLSSFRRSGETFSSHFRDKQYQCLKEELASDRVMSIGLDPMIAPYHSISAIDGYHNLYPVSYKHRFGKIIADQLAVSPRGPDYFYRWGSRLNTFVTAPNQFLLNLDAARDLGATALVSEFELVELGDPTLICRDDLHNPIYAYKFKK